MGRSGLKMRVFLAAIFVFVGLLLSIILFGNWLNHATPIWAVVFGIGNGLFFIMLILIALFLFNTPLGKQLKVETQEAFFQKLEAQGLLISQDYKAIRAYEVPEFEDEGLHYFLELEDGSVLYLTGQYLYDYELIDDGPEFSQPKRFPCTEFTRRWHRDEDYIVDILCRGTVLEPRGLAISLNDVWQRSDWPEDGQVLTGQAFDKLKTLVRSKGL